MVDFVRKLDGVNNSKIETKNEKKGADSEINSVFNPKIDTTKYWNDKKTGLDVKPPFIEKEENSTPKTDEKAPKAEKQPPAQKTKYVVQLGETIEQLVTKSLKAQGIENPDEKQLSEATAKFKKENNNIIKSNKKGVEYLLAGKEAILDGAVDTSSNKTSKEVNEAWAKAREEKTAPPATPPKEENKSEQKASTPAEPAKPQAPATTGTKEQAKPEQKASTPAETAKPQPPATTGTKEQAKPEQKASTPAETAKPQTPATTGTKEQAKPEQKASTPAETAKPQTPAATGTKEQAKPEQKASTPAETAKPQTPAATATKDETTTVTQDKKAADVAPVKTEVITKKISVDELKKAGIDVKKDAKFKQHQNGNLTQEYKDYNITRVETYDKNKKLIQKESRYFNGDVLTEFYKNGKIDKKEIKEKDKVVTYENYVNGKTQKITKVENGNITSEYDFKTKKWIRTHETPTQTDPKLFDNAMRNRASAILKAVQRPGTDEKTVLHNLARNYALINDRTQGFFLTKEEYSAIDKHIKKLNTTTPDGYKKNGLKEWIEKEFDLSDTKNHNNRIMKLIYDDMTEKGL